MEIPTRSDRHRSLYSEQIERYMPLINQAILTEQDKEDRRGYRYIPVELESDGRYIHSEIIAWLDAQYKKAGWLIEQSEYDGNHETRIYYRTKST